MANDIIAINSGNPINNISMVCSALPTGSGTIKIISSGTPVDLTITNIQSKYDIRFTGTIY